MDNDLPILAMERIIKQAGAQRVSMDAKIELRNQLEAYAKIVSKKANELAKHANRSTVRKEDIALAIKQKQE